MFCVEGMIVIHANDSTTEVLSLLYKSRNDITEHITEANTNVDVKKALLSNTSIMMLGHGNQYGLFSRPSKNGKYERLLITDKHVQFLRGKVCIGIWCYANVFAERYGLHGVFSGMIVSELQEAIDNHIVATKDEIDYEMELFTIRLKYCLENYKLEEIPKAMKCFDYLRTPLNEFNYNNIFYY